MYIINKVRGNEKNYHLENVMLCLSYSILNKMKFTLALNDVLLIVIAIIFLYCIKWRGFRGQPLIIHSFLLNLSLSCIFPTYHLISTVMEPYFTWPSYFKFLMIVLKIVVWGYDQCAVIEPRIILISRIFLLQVLWMYIYLQQGWCLKVLYFVVASEFFSYIAREMQ